MKRNRISIGVFIGILLFIVIALFILIKRDKVVCDKDYNYALIVADYKSAAQPKFKKEFKDEINNLFTRDDFYKEVAVKLYPQDFDINDTQAFNKIHSKYKFNKGIGIIGWQIPTRFFQCRLKLYPSTTSFLNIAFDTISEQIIYLPNDTIHFTTSTNCMVDLVDAMFKIAKNNNSKALENFLSILKKCPSDGDFTNIIIKLAATATVKEGYNQKDRNLIIHGMNIFDNATRPKEAIQLLSRISTNNNRMNVNEDIFYTEGSEMNLNIIDSSDILLKSIDIQLAKIKVNQYLVNQDPVRNIKLRKYESLMDTLKVDLDNMVSFYKSSYISDSTMSAFLYKAKLEVRNYSDSLYKILK